MDATLTGDQAPRLKRSSVRRIQPNLDGGRPPDPLTLAFEGVMEGLVATDDDRKAFESAADRLHQIRMQETRLIHHLEARASRISEHVGPELRRIAVETDQTLTERTEARR